MTILYWDSARTSYIEAYTIKPRCVYYCLGARRVTVHANALLMGNLSWCSKEGYLVNPVFIQSHQRSFFSVSLSSLWVGGWGLG